MSVKCFGGVSEALVVHNGKFEEDDLAFIAAFESLALPFDEWNHIAHVRMAFLMLKLYGHEADDLIVAGIKAYNAKHTDKLKVGYHETITRFWINAIKSRMVNTLSFEQWASQNEELLRFDYIYQYYSREALFSARAKDTWVTPA